MNDSKRRDPYREARPIGGAPYRVNRTPVVEPKQRTVTRVRPTSSPGVKDQTYSGTAPVAPGAHGIERGRRKS